MDNMFMKNIPSKIMNFTKNGPIGKAVDSFGQNMKNFVNNARQSRAQNGSGIGQAISEFAQQNNKMNWPKPPQAQEYANRPLMQRDYLRKSPANKGPADNV